MFSGDDCTLLQILKLEYGKTKNNKENRIIIFYMNLTFYDFR